MLLLESVHAFEDLGDDSVHDNSTPQVEIVDGVLEVFFKEPIEAVVFAMVLLT